ncbi:MAG: response regulator [Desulfovibrionaceae bacterium]|jgi:DNA-binding response OmpR family regulator|nr:response regulator [Desulfovibrionaceae bacterium]
MKKGPILLVDDERAFVDALSERLRLRGFDARVAYDGTDALVMLQDETYAGMILDLRMPGIDGLQVLEEMRRMGLAVPVAVLTGHGGDEDRRRCAELGAAHYLQKPAPLRDLVEVINSMCGPETA